MVIRTRDMTEGKPANLIITFALPLMLGNVFQQAYTLVDAIVVGRVAGVEALAALGASDWLNWMLLGLVVGFTHGFTILVSQHFGAKDLGALRNTVAMSIILSAGIAIIMTILGLLFARPMLDMMNTPNNIIDDAYIYLTILFSGIPIVTAYNITSSILRAMGDSKTPLWAMIIASVINIILDLIFVAGFHWGVAGAAIATVISQLFSFLYCLKTIWNIPFLNMENKDWKLDKQVIKSLLKLGTPMAFQNTVIGAGGIVVQYIINGFGFIFVAAFTATNKLYGLLELAASSFGYAVATFTGQNLGARKYQRIRDGVNSGIKMSIATACTISVVMISMGRNILKLFISGTPEEVSAVIDIAYRYLFVMAAMLFILYLLHLYRSALQGMGDTVIPMISGIAELIMRVSVIIFLPLLIGETGIYFAEVAAWLGAAIILMGAYYFRINKLQDTKFKLMSKTY
ncbi:MAG TPA: MATE family efflux transporter [Clostridia bacterium]|nr:MATE family efflux transporter [Clostridia bacterium]